MGTGWSLEVQMNRSRQKKELLRHGAGQKKILLADGMDLKKDSGAALECMFHHLWKNLGLLK